MAKTKRAVSPEDLAEATKHLAYEVIMLRHTTSRIAGQSNQLDWNSFFESFGIHTRVLYDFFSNKGDDGSSIRSITFQTNYRRGDLKGINHVIEDINGQIAHFSRDRIFGENTKVSKEKVSKVAHWLEVEIASFLSNIAEEFRVIYQTELQLAAEYQNNIAARQSNEVAGPEVVPPHTPAKGPTGTSGPTN